MLTFGAGLPQIRQMQDILCILGRLDVIRPTTILRPPGALAPHMPQPGDALPRP